MSLRLREKLKRVHLEELRRYFTLPRRKGARTYLAGYPRVLVNCAAFHQWRVARLPGCALASHPTDCQLCKLPVRWRWPK